jgi:hypothetical protein
MATDPKLISQLLDLSRNIDKLSGEVKKNTTVNKDLVKADSAESKAPSESKDAAKIAEGLKSLDFKGLKDEFKGLKDGLKGIDKLDFKGLENGIKSLDFKGLEKGLKGLDFKGITEGLKGFDVKGITESFKGISDLKNMDLGGMAKNLTSGSGVKDFISGSAGNIGKGILGGFKSGGKVEIPGAYLVGEGGPEIAKLPKDTTVIPNDKTEAILSEKPSSINDKLKKKNGTKYPSKEEIDEKRSQLLSEDPVFYSDPDELNDELEYYIENYRIKSEQKTFTKEDIAKLGKPANKSESLSSVEPKVVTKPESIVSGKSEIPKKDESSNLETSKNSPEMVEKKPGLFSKTFSKDNIKGVAGKIESGASGLLGGGLKDKLTGTLKGSADTLINKPDLNIPDIAKSSLTSGLSFLKKGSNENVENPGISGGDIKKNLPSLSNVSLSKTKAEPAQKAAPVPEPVTSPVKEASGNSTESNTEGASTTDSSSAPKSEDNASSGGSITRKDIDTIIAALSRMGSLLEGPLSVTSLDSPMRPDSRRI